jgi:uncharacterized membrane protein YedE/YeeE
MWRMLAGLCCGALFAVGLGVAQMTDPHKVQAFLDITGDWDPSLAFVMGGAVLVALLGFRLIQRLQTPVLDSRFHWPVLTQVDRPLVLGSALFGIGWGLTGYCPGPAIANLFAGGQEVWWFVPAMLAGGWLQGAWAAHTRRTA